MKRLLLLLVIGLLLIYCEKREPVLAGSVNEFNKTDPTYSKHFEDWVFDTIPIDLETTIPDLEEWSEAIRIVGNSDWFGPDYVCTIYKSEPTRIQLIGWMYQFYKRYGDSPLRVFTFKEKIIEETVYDSIFSAIVKLGIPKMEMDLQPGRGCVGCDLYTILLKNKDYKKLVHWRYLLPEQDTFPKRNIGIQIHQEILEYAGYPKPEVVVEKRMVKQDSTIYSCFFDNRMLAKKLSLQALDNSERFRWQEKIEQESIKLVLSNQDTSDLDSMIQFLGIQESGDTLILKIKG